MIVNLQVRQVGNAWEASWEDEKSVWTVRSQCCIMWHDKDGDRPHEDIESLLFNKVRAIKLWRKD